MNNAQTHYMIGLSGGIGTGKSLASFIFAKKNIPIIDADILAKKVTEKGSEGLKKIIATFGENYLDSVGNLDRKKMAELIFDEKDNSNRQRLENIVHPLIEDELRISCEKFIKNKQLFIFAAPLLFEKNIHKRCLRTILITCTQATAIERIKTRDNVSEYQAKQRINCQMSEKEKKKLADFIVENNGSIEDFEKKLIKVWESILKEITAN